MTKEITEEQLAHELSLSWFNPKNEAEVLWVQDLFDIIIEYTPVTLMQLVFSNFLQGRYWKG